jgi:hypothetical protein
VGWAAMMWAALSTCVWAAMFSGPVHVGFAVRASRGARQT